MEGQYEAGKADFVKIYNSVKHMFDFGIKDVRNKKRKQSKQQIWETAHYRINKSKYLLVVE